MIPESVISVPMKMDEYLAEETGIHIGDGSMNFYDGKGLYSLRGHRFDDEEYYRTWIKDIYKRIYNLEISIRVWPDVIGFQKWSDKIVNFKREFLGLPLGKKREIRIPVIIMNNPMFSAACIRGFFDTDGCVFLEKKSPSFCYPRIILKSTSNSLMSQTKQILEGFGFNLCLVKHKRKEIGWKDIFILETRGFKNAERWLKIIGTNNPKHKKRLLNSLSKHIGDV